MANRVAITGAVIASLVGFVSAMSQSFAENDPGSPGTSVAKGHCSRLITGADDYTAKCDAQAASVTLADGTIFFIFSIEGTPVGFSGDGSLVSSAAGFDGAARLPVNFVSIGMDGSLGAFEAEGHCVFGDPYSGAANIWCIAITKAGPFVATFKTDGSPPVRSGE